MHWTMQLIVWEKHRTHRWDFSWYMSDNGTYWCRSHHGYGEGSCRLTVSRWQVNSSPRAGSQISWYTWYPRIIASMLKLSTPLSPIMLVLSNLDVSFSTCHVAIKSHTRTYPSLVWELRNRRGQWIFLSAKNLSAKFCANPIHKKFAPWKFSGVRYA